MKTNKHAEEVSHQMSNDEILDLIAAKIQNKDLFRKEKEMAKRILLNAKVEAEGFPSLKDIKID